MQAVALVFGFVTVVAFSQTTPQDLSEPEGQRVLDAAIATADHLTIKHTWCEWIPLKNEALRATTVREISAREEIHALSKYFRVRIAPPTKAIVDGREVLTPEQGHFVDTPRFFTLLLQHKGAELVTIVLLSENSIGCEAVRRGSAIRVDLASLRPFYEELKRTVLGQSVAASTFPPVSPDYPTDSVIKERLQSQLQKDVHAYVSSRLWAESRPERIREFSKKMFEDLLQGCPGSVEKAEKGECPSDAALEEAYTELSRSGDIRHLLLVSYYFGLWTARRLNLEQRILFQRAMILAIPVLSRNERDRASHLNSPARQAPSIGNQTPTTALPSSAK